jgi:5-methylcytosine-specific restriction endonuclease McrA
VSHTDRRAVRRAVADRCRWRCAYCRRQLVEGADRVEDRPTLDHVVPRSRGGTNRQRNLVLACPPCNGRKADLELAAWLAVCGLPARVRSARALAELAAAA